MHIAFYAPMKPPDSAIPSGEREMARNLVGALERHHTVEIASRFSSHDGTGNARRQDRIAAIGENLAARLVRRWRTGYPGVPDAWFTYHVYH